MEDQSQYTLDRLSDIVLQVCRMSHLPKSLFGPVAFADLPRMSRLYIDGHIEYLRRLIKTYLYFKSLMSKWQTMVFEMM